VNHLLDSPSVQAWLLPLVVFVAEMLVVTIGTVRIIFVSRGMKVLAPLLGFFEVLIWLFAISQIMQNLTNPACYVAFAGGFTLGNFLGILIEGKLAMGTSVVRIITHRDAGELVANLRAASYGVTCVDGEGATGPVQIVFTVVKRKEVGVVVAIIHRFDPKAFYSVDELQSASRGIFPGGKRRPSAIPRPHRLMGTGRVESEAAPAHAASRRDAGRGASKRPAAANG
jgi:uncharacterized protein YebE (UPF0316 family)